MSSTQNGSQKPTETVVKPTNGATTKPTVATTVEAAVITTQVEKKPQLPPIEKRIEKLKTLLEVSERRDKIVEALESFGKFYIAPTGSSCSLRLTDSNANSFTVSNSLVISEMVELAKNKLRAELQEIETQFDFSI
jgi:hypothetical protein